MKISRRIRFYLYHDKNINSGVARINLYVMFEKRTFSFLTEIKVFRRDWNKKSQRAKESSPSNGINNSLDEISAFIDAIFSQYENENIIPSVRDILKGLSEFHLKQNTIS